MAVIIIIILVRTIKEDAAVKMSQVYWQIYPELAGSGARKERASIRFDGLFGLCLSL